MAGGKCVSDKSVKIMEESMREKVKMVMELTSRSEEEACLALHESDNDISRAVNLLYEDEKANEWERKEKKKKKRQPSAGKKEENASAASGDKAEENTQNNASNSSGNSGNIKERSERRDKSGDGSAATRSRWRKGSSWRGRERGDHHNDEGANSNNNNGGRRPGRGLGMGRGAGGSRGGGGGRGRGGGRAGGRYQQNRYNRMGSDSKDYNKQSIDTWDNSTAAATTNHIDEWDDLQTDEWSTEEYTGSLMETKVFTPSVPPQNLNDIVNSAPDINLDPNLAAAVVQQDPKQFNPSMGQAYNNPALAQMQSGMHCVGSTLTPAQTQYFSQLTQQNNDNLNKFSANSTSYRGNDSYDASVNPQVYRTGRSQAAYTTTSPPYDSSAMVYNATTQTYTSTQPYSSSQANYGNTLPASNYTVSNYPTEAGKTQQTAQIPVAKNKIQRARIPPPSKIPAKAVEMIGELNNTKIGDLDIEFGGLRIGDLTDNSFDLSQNVADVKYGAAETNRSGTVAANIASTVSSSLDNSVSTQSTSVLEIGGSGNGGTGGSNSSGVVPAHTNQNVGGIDVGTYGSTKNITQSSINTVASPNLSATTESSQQTSDSLSYNNITSTSRSTAQVAAAPVNNSAIPSVSTQTLDLINKPPTESVGSGSVSGGVAGSVSGHAYNSSTSSFSSYPSKLTTYTTPYNTTQTPPSSYTNTTSNYLNNQANSYMVPQNTNTFANNNYSSTVSYQNANMTGMPFPSVTQSVNSYHSAAHTFPMQQNASHLIYGANAGLNNGSNFLAPANQYNYNSAATTAKLNKDNTYDSGSAAVVNNSASSTAAINVTSTTSTLSITQTTVTNSNSSKGSTALAKNSNNMPPMIQTGATPVMSTPYIMGQVPYFQQTLYSFVDEQMVQPRHMPTPYYDVSYQTPPTTLPAAVRGGDPTTGLLSGYSAISTDGRFATAAARGDGGNTSPVPSSSTTLGAQQQGHQAAQPPILAAGTAPYFFASYNTIAPAPPPNYAQFGAPMYAQLPTATNHSSNTGNQYGPKSGATYAGSAGYGAYYTQDFSKGYTVNAAGVISASQQAQKVQGSSTTAGNPASANDLSNMYSGGGKSHAALSKSYDKQGFHSGTPPPYTGVTVTLHGNQNAGLAPSGSAGYPPQVYIPTIPPHQQHSAMALHQPLHQMDVIRHQGRRADTGNTSTGPRSQPPSQQGGKTVPSKQQNYSSSYWNQN